MTATAPKVYIVVVNWNAWRHTVECLESVLRLDYPRYQVLVCDNGSVDGSMEWMRRWARGDPLPGLARNPQLQHLCPGGIDGPVPHVVHEEDAVAPVRGRSGSDSRVVFIKTGKNLGFAGANNVALRYALARDDFEYVWLLNNDTVVSPDALTRLVARMTSDSALGQCGSQLRFYNEPELIQAMGGAVYDPWSATARHIGEGTPVGQRASSTAWVEARISYVVGASLLVSRQFIRTVGLMSEEYFFFFEEIDWVKRSRGRFKLGYAPDSVVYHKGTASLTSQQAGPPHPLVEFYYTRSRVRFTRLYYPAILPALCFSLGARVVYRFLVGRRRDAVLMWRALSDPSIYLGRRLTARPAPEQYA